MILIVGLGNPGPEYKKTRHNVGFMVLDELAGELKLETFKPEKKFSAELATVHIDGKKIILAKPQTFMNLSGETVQSLSAFYKIKPENIYIICDDLDLPLGQIRIRRKGGPGTHNGLKSVVEYIGEDFPRLRVGIESRGKSAPALQETVSFVLTPFTSKERPLVQKGIKNAINSLLTIIKSGIDTAMNEYNQI
ncbi:aminoacyl-tRNA hydrolase [Patescibacteria group bacterium]|nr:aminoacyl-tRNA hydrolase [Patescibacteria group bacterium]MBU1702940.1 aminoacyl-tRNA hydrolase [Patescibacteria group bacterium]MBU1953832.1 aminoacyl-tRNA hydrolase [Patescibacteria group bacterium]